MRAHVPFRGIWAAAIAVVTVTGCSRGNFVPLTVGQCLPEGAGVEGVRPQQVPTVSCADSHRYQVFAIVELEPPSTEWPGEETVSLNAEHLCARAIEDSTGTAAKDITTDVKLVHVDPTEESWRDGDREVECLFRWEEPTTDTLVRR